MATRIEFHKHGGPEVLQAVEFTPADPAENEIQVENKAIGINMNIIINATRINLKSNKPAKIHAINGMQYIHQFTKKYSRISLPAAISFEQAAASFLKGLTVYYLLRKTYEIKPDEQFLFHAAAGGVGLIACQWAKALGAKLIGTVGTAQKAQSALKAGAWQVINYREEDLVERLKEITGGKKVRVVYDSVGRDTWERSLDCLQRRGLMVSFGNSSGAVTGVNLGILNQKGSLYVTRPSLQGYITTREELTEASNELFSLIASGVIKVDVAEQQKYPLKDAQRAHEILESRATQGSSLLIP